ncbi:MAG: YhcH/YjgK/YiaL family protein [Bacteroidota bacterium]
MILDHIKNAPFYFSLNPYFKTVFEHLQKAELKDFENKKTDINENAFLLYFDTEGKGKEQVKLECHQKYLDIHYVIKGNDLVGYKETSFCTAIATDGMEKDDYRLFNDKPVSEINIPEDYFMIVFPGDAHAPLMGTGKFLKIVAKVKVQ